MKDTKILTTADFESIADRARFEALTALFVKIQDFWEVT
jgi:hypothetical protein